MTKRASAASEDSPSRSFSSREKWEQWLDKNHAKSTGIAVRMAKAASGIRSVRLSEAVETALCYGWIDSRGERLDDSWWSVRFVPRRPRSMWSRINRERAQRLIKERRMKAAGLAAIESAKRDGRWDAAYDPPSKAAPPPELQAELDRRPRAAAFFAGLDSRNRYAILFRIRNAKRAQTKARLVEKFVSMLERRERIYP